MAAVLQPFAVSTAATCSYCFRNLFQMLVGTRTDYKVHYIMSSVAYDDLTMDSDTLTLCWTGILQIDSHCCHLFY